MARIYIFELPVLTDTVRTLVAASETKYFFELGQRDRNRDFWRMRHLAKQMQLIWNRESPSSTPREHAEKYLELKQELEHLWSRYGFKSMVMDKRRRNSTRSGNQRFARVSRRRSKRAEKHKLRQERLDEISNLEENQRPSY